MHNLLLILLGFLAVIGPLGLAWAIIELQHRNPNKH